LWIKWDEILGQELAGHLMELLRPAYESVMARQAAGEEAPDPMVGISPTEDRDRHNLWRKFDEKLGLDEARTMIELWDEAGRLKYGTAMSRAA
jgi:hypothetical protein